MIRATNHHLQMAILPIRSTGMASADPSFLPSFLVSFPSVVFLAPASHFPHQPSTHDPRAPPGHPRGAVHAPCARPFDVSVILILIAQKLIT